MVDPAMVAGLSARVHMVMELEVNPPCAPHTPSPALPHHVPLTHSTMSTSYTLPRTSAPCAPHTLFPF
eukprot:1033845-Rhodomonas_salina.1